VAASGLNHGPQIRVSPNPDVPVRSLLHSFHGVLKRYPFRRAQGRHQRRAKKNFQKGRKANHRQKHSRRQPFTAAISSLAISHIVSVCCDRSHQHNRFSRSLHGESCSIAPREGGPSRLSPFGGHALSTHSLSAGATTGQQARLSLSTPRMEPSPAPRHAIRKAKSQKKKSSKGLTFLSAVLDDRRRLPREFSAMTFRSMDSKIFPARRGHLLHRRIGGIFGPLHTI